jgi:hypothetical protein
MNIRLWGQVILQVAGLIYATVKYRNEDIQSVDNYVPKVEYDLPFDGEWYVINGGITENTSHSWEVLPQRYAYDFAIVDEAGESCSGDIKDVRNYYCYGKDILAPADGIIVSLKNNFPDCKIMGNGQTDPATPDIGGNRIIIKHASNEYSAICHLMYGSVNVKEGQVVKRGEVIAKCGNSGNTSEPHVHFQIQNSAYFYACIGKPILFPNIHKRVYAKYDMVDTRPFPEEPIKVGYIHRGLLVKNLGKKEV